MIRIQRNAGSSGRGWFKPKARKVRAVKRGAFRSGAFLTALILLSVTLTGCFPDRAGMERVREISAKRQAQEELERLAKERQKPSSAEKLTDLTKDLRADLEKVDKATLQSAKDKLSKLDLTIQSEFRQTQSKIAKIGAKKAQKRHQKFVATYEKKMEKLNRGLDAVLAADGKTAALKAESLSKYLASLIPKEKHQPLGTDLPHRNVDYQAGEPILGTNIAPAYMGQTQGLEPSTLPRTPTSDDLTETVDTKQTEAIKKLADQLGKDPVKIYEFVRNNIVYEPYYGSRKGAQETLWEKGGNDIDQANLLLALFRYSNIPSRYVTGVVEIPIDKAMNWVGVEKPEVAAQVFSSAGIPSKAIVRGGKIDAIQLEHTWAEAYVSYSRYRGVDEGAGGPKSWVALDASFKSYEYKEPMDIKGILSLDTSSYLTTDTAALSAKINEATAALENYIDENMPDATLADIVGLKTIKEELGLLPNSMPVGISPLSIAREQTGLIDNQRYRLDLRADGFDYSTSLPELAGKRVTLYYSPATQEDADLVVQYGSLFSVPAYLIKVKPIVLVNDEAKAEGSPITLGQWQDLSISLSNQAISDTSVKSLSAGAYYAIGLDYGQVTAEVIKQRKLDLEQDLAAVDETDTPVSGDEITGELLNLTALMYSSQVDSLSNMMANLTKTAVFKEPSVAIPSYTIDTAYVFGAPSAVKSSGADFDVIMDSYIVKAKDGDQQKARSWTISSGHLASGAEHAIFEQMYQTEAVSTVKILNLASEQGVPIHQLTAENLSSELELVQTTPEIKDEIRNSVIQGRVITIPEKPITYRGWTGTGWVDMDPVTGAAGYMIQGGLAGGELVEAADGWLNKWGLLTDLGGILVEKISYTDHYGHQQVRYRWFFSKKFTTTAFGRAFAQAFQVISLLILPLAEALFQFLSDLHNPNLTYEQKLQRAGIVFAVMATMALGVSMFLGPIAGIVVSVFVGIIWSAVSETVLDYYVSPTASRAIFGGSKVYA